MRLLAPLVFGGVVVIAACGSGTTDACTKYATVYCNQNYNCATGAQLAALQQKYGADAATCAKSYAAFNCNTDNPCPAGTSYDTGRAEQCTTEYAALSCSVIQAGTTPSDCQLNTYICH